MPGNPRSGRLDQLSNFRRYRCSNHSGDCRPCMGENYACSQQSRTKRNTGINSARSDSTASRRYLRNDHRDGALTAFLPELGRFMRFARSRAA
jgi:hypothetical protein